MERIFLNTNKDLNKLMAMMFMDIGKYTFEKRKNGVLIELDDESIESIETFARTFAKWFTRATFLENGDQYFENHPQQERWNIWKLEGRFSAAYVDDLFEATIERRWFDFLHSISDFDSINLNVQELFNDAYEITEIRLQLIDQHFSEDIHEGFISRRMEQKFGKKPLVSHKI